MEVIGLEWAWGILETAEMRTPLGASAYPGTPLKREAPPLCPFPSVPVLITKGVICSYKAPSSLQSTLRGSELSCIDLRDVPRSVEDPALRLTLSLKECRLVAGVRARMEADPAFTFKLGCECGLDLAIIMIVNLACQRDKFFKELDFVLSQVRCPADTDCLSLPASIPRHELRHRRLPSCRLR